MSVVLITGASCFIGKPLTEKMLELGNIVYAVVRNPEKITLRDKNLHVIRCKMSEYDILKDMIGEKVDTFYHLAWDGTRGADRQDKKKQQDNLVASLEVVHAAYQMGAKAFVCIGSQAEYGNCEGVITEEYPAHPTTEYGKAKLEMYNKGRQFADEVGMKFLWPRIFSAYGVGDFEGTMVISSLEKMLKNEPVQLSPCTQMWDFINLHDVISALIRLPKADSGIYNFASGEHRVLREFVEEMKIMAGSTSELQYGANTSAAVVSFMPDCSKLKKAIDWKPEVSFEAGINEIINSLRSCDENN